MILEKLVGYYRRQRWNWRWRLRDFQPPWLKDGPRAFVVTGFDNGWLAPGMTVLEIGCGPGQTTAWLAARGLHAQGIDFSPSAIDRARRLHVDQPRLAFAVVDVCAANTLTATFDVLIDTGCFQAIPKLLHQRYKANLLRWSRPGSRFVVPVNVRDAAFDEQVAQVRSLFCPPFEFEHCEETPSSLGRKPKPVIHLIRRHPASGENRRRVRYGAPS